VSNLLASFGAIFHILRLFYPWLIFYFLSIVSTLSILVYVIISLQNNWFRIILFLVVVPFLVIAISFWSVILSLARRIRAAQRKVTSRSPKIPLTAQESNTVSLPLPVRSIALSPPEAAWDPDYLIERDPRYVEGSEGESCQEEEDSCGYRDSYAERRGSGSEWDSEEDTYYLSDEYTDMADREDTEDFTESEADTYCPFKGKRNCMEKAEVTDNENFTEFEEDLPEIYPRDCSLEEAALEDDNKVRPEDLEIYENVNTGPVPESEHYQVPGVPRPVLRCETQETYCMQGTTLHSSTA